MPIIGGVQVVLHLWWWTIARLNHVATKILRKVVKTLQKWNFFFRENNDKLSSSFNVHTWKSRLSNWKALKRYCSRHVLEKLTMHITASFGISQKNKNWKHTCLLSKKHRPYLYLFSKWWRKILQIRKWLTARGYFHSLVLMDLGEYFLPGRKLVEGI